MATRDGIALTVISALGIAALVWLLPLSAHWPFLMPPAMYDKFVPIKKPFAGLMDMTPVSVGIAVVTLWAVAFGCWMSWSTSRTVVVQGTSHRSRSDD